LPFHLEQKHWLRTGIFIIVILVLAFTVYYTGISQRLTPGYLKSYLARAGPYAPLLFISAFISAFFLRVPGFIFIILGAIVFERFPAIMYSFIAIATGTSLTFFMARFFLRDTVSKMEIRGVRGLKEKIAKRGFLTVLFLRLVFFLLPPLNWMLGVTPVKYRDYLFGTILGVAPGVLILALVFGDMGDISLVSGIKDYRLFLPSLAGILLLILFFLFKRYIKKWLN